MVWGLFGGDDALLGIERERARGELSLAAGVGLAEAIDYVSGQQRDIADLTERLLGTDAPSSVKFRRWRRCCRITSRATLRTTRMSTCWALQPPLPVTLD
jgi:hypothetical protein